MEEWKSEKVEEWKSGKVGRWKGFPYSSTYSTGWQFGVPYDILRPELTTPQRRPTMTTTLASVPLPCSAAQLENASLKVAHNGHWHDAEVKVHGDKLVITYEDEDA